MLNNYTYCYIKLIKFEEDAKGYERVKNLINSTPNLVIDEINGEEFIGFISDDKYEKNDLVNKVYPFIFKYDEQKKRFIDVISGEIYSFHTYDNEPDKRKFYEDKGNFGEYIEATDSLKINLTKEEVSALVNQINIREYKDSLRELTTVVLNGYKDAYAPQGCTRHDGTFERRSRGR